MISNSLFERGLRDLYCRPSCEIIKEPFGGAHRNKEQIIFSTREVLNKYLEEFERYSKKEIFEQRKEKFLNIGKQKTFAAFSKEAAWIEKSDFFASIKKFLFKFKIKLLLIFLLIFLSFLFFI